MIDYNSKQIKTTFAQKWKWLLRAIGNNHDRKCMNWVYCYGNRYIASDGNRIHCINGIENKSGFYDRDFNLICSKDLFDYPDIIKIFDKYIAVSPINIDDLIITDKSGKIEFKINKYTGIESKYLLDSIVDLSFPNIYKFNYSFEKLGKNNIIINYDDIDNAIYINSGDLESIIMGIDLR